MNVDFKMKSLAKSSKNSWTKLIALKHTVWIVSLLSFLLSGLSAHACDLCAVYNVVETQQGEEGSLRTGLAHQFTYYESNFSGHNQPSHELTSNITQVFGSYNLSSKLALQLNLPLIYRDYRRIKDGIVDSGSESGVGDMALLLKWLPYRKHNLNDAAFWQLYTGVKLPTGSTDKLREDAPLKISSAHDSEPHHKHAGHDHGDQVPEVEEDHTPAAHTLISGHDLTLGSGSYDFILGTAAFYQRDRLFVGANLQYVIRREGDYDYQFGNDMNWDIGPGYYILLKDEQTLSARLRFAGEHKEKDSTAGHSHKGSEKLNMYLGPELGFTLSNNFHFTLAIDIPIQTESSLNQVVPRYRMLGALSYRFDL